MILEQHKKEILSSEAFESKKLGLSEKNQSIFIYNLLKTLYSNARSAIVKELVSNVKDSHIEAGTPEKEGIIELIEENRLLGTSNELRISDFGLGISPERFDQIYRSLGESTKRESNEFNGSFGLG